MASEYFSNLSPDHPGYERLFEFNFLPSRYIQPQQASALLPEAWCARLAEDAVSARIHAHMSTYLLQCLQVADAWVYATDSIAVKLALLGASTLSAFTFRLGLALVGQSIRQCVRREQRQKLDKALTSQDWDFVFQEAALASPSAPGVESLLFSSPREAIMGVGCAALQKLTATLAPPARVRFDLKRPVDPLSDPLPEWGATVREESLIVLSQAVLAELDPDWDMTFSEVSE